LYKIVICEDHDVVVEGIKLMLAGDTQFTLCGHARNEQELIGLMESENPQILLLDLNLKKQDGFSLLELLKPRYPN
jgi:two-component system nitrate/nitrite response regulator NarL